jgi:ribbon-helix-helix CopG family protein
MPSTRTQIYLTREQRRKLEARRRREGKSMAAVIRDAVDDYLDGRHGDMKAVLDATFGIDPKFSVPSRDEWAHRTKRARGG